MSRKNEIRSNISGRKKASAGLPAQLQQRVKSGAVTQQRAQQTAQERQTLKAAFGNDWRKQVYGQGGAKAMSGPFSQAQIRTDRSKALEEARARLAKKRGSVQGGRRAY